MHQVKEQKIAATFRLPATENTLLYSNSCKSVANGEVFNEIVKSNDMHFTLAAEAGCGLSPEGMSIMLAAINADWKVAIVDLGEEGDSNWFKLKKLPLLLASARVKEIDEITHSVIDLLCRSTQRVVLDYKDLATELINTTKLVSEQFVANGDTDNRLLIIEAADYLDRTNLLNSFYPVWLNLLKQCGVKLLMLNTLSQHYKGEWVERMGGLTKHLDAPVVKFFKLYGNSHWQMHRVEEEFNSNLKRG